MRILWLIGLVLYLAPTSTRAVEIAIADAMATSDAWEQVLVLTTADNEGHLDPEAPHGKAGERCMMQVLPANLLELGYDPDAISLVDCVRAGLAVIRRSDRQCRRRPVAERQTAYLAGTCDGAPDVAVARSRARVQRATWLLARFPPP